MPNRDSFLTATYACKVLLGAALLFTDARFFIFIDLLALQLGVTSSAALVLGHLAPRNRPELARWRKRAWGAEMLAVVLILGHAIYLLVNEEGNRGHGQDAILGLILLVLVVLPAALLAQLPLIPFSGEPVNPGPPWDSSETGPEARDS